MISYVAQTNSHCNDLCLAASVVTQPQQPTVSYDLYTGESQPLHRYQSRFDIWQINGMTLSQDNIQPRIPTLRLRLILITPATDIADFAFRHHCRQLLIEFHFAIAPALRQIAAFHSAAFRAAAARHLPPPAFRARFRDI